jgi:lipopolysaccharide cholinephosphotransferase
MVELRLEFPPDFFREETRCDYFISSEMKEIWAIELDLLSQLLEVCKKHDIKIFASGGTLLGAIRHRGMIPWDDDIDMMMFREDYDKLCSIAKEEFHYPYFFQTEYTDPGSLRGHAQLRNSETTAILQNEKGRARFNQGIFIDIFPLDSVVDDKELFQKQCHEARRFKHLAAFLNSISVGYAKRTGWKGTVKTLLHFFLGAQIQNLRLEQRAYKKFESICCRYNNIPTKLVTTISFSFDLERDLKYRRDFEEIKYVPFEFMMIPVGSLFDEALSMRYGNYHQFVKGSSCHGTVFFDSQRSYKEYIKGNGCLV